MVLLDPHISIWLHSWMTGFGCYSAAKDPALVKEFINFLGSVLSLLQTLTAAKVRQAIIMGTICQICTIPETQPSTLQAIRLGPPLICHGCTLGSVA